MNGNGLLPEQVAPFLFDRMVGCQHNESDRRDNAVKPALAQCGDALTPAIPSNASSAGSGNFVASTLDTTRKRAVLLSGQRPMIRWYAVRPYLTG
jgi:hypothetical protein